MSEMKSLTLNDKTYDSFVDQTARALAAATAVIKPVSGEIIALSDSGSNKLFGLRIFGKTTQDGTPTPDAPVELVSVGDIGSIGVAVATGKNLLAKPFLFGVHSTSGYSNINDRVASTDGFCLKAGTYVVSGQINDSWTLYINGMRDTTTANGYQVSYVGRVFTIPDDGLYNVQFNKTDGNSFTSAELQVLNNSVQVEIGSTPTGYEPYKGQTLTISTPKGLPGISSTCDKIDLARGVHSHRFVRYSLAVADMNSSEDYPGWKNTGIAEYYPDASNAIGRYGALSMCNIDKNPSDSVHINTKSGADVLMIPNPNNMTQSEWKSKYPNLVFELLVSIPTPIETPLSEEELAAFDALHTYRDHTTVSNDGFAYMELEYVMDAKKYIDSMISSTIIQATVE